jgi:hypothetical protein
MSVSKHNGTCHFGTQAQIELVLYSTWSLQFYFFPPQFVQTMSASKSTSFPYPADRLALVEKKDKDKDFTILKNKTSRRSRRHIKEQETLLAYAVGSKVTSASGLETPLAETQPVLKKVRLEPRKGFSLVVPATDSESSALDTPWPGTSGPDADAAS